MRWISALLVVILSSLPLDADTYDRYLEPVLAKAAESPNAVELKKLAAEEVAKHGNLVGNSSGALLIVRTNNGRWAKVIAQFARQKEGEETLPIALLERGVTFKEGSEQVVAATFASLRLYDGFRLSLDLGQVVPEKLGGDLRYVADAGDGHLEPVGKAKVYLVTRQAAEVEAKKAAKPLVGDVFEASVIAGTYKLFDDGRRTATLILKVDEKGEIAGDYISEKTGGKYEVGGKVQPNKHHIVFSVTFPNSVQTFTGWVFTKDASAMAGFTNTQGRDFGFYAVRAEP